MDPVREIWLIRHGQTASNVERVIQGQTANGLSDEGRRQAVRLAARLAEAELDTRLVLSSPLPRALATAEPLAAALGVPVHADAGLQERGFGVWEGRPAALAYATQDASGPDPFAWAPEGGESTHAMAERAVAALRRAADRTDAGAHLAVVSHGGPIAAVVCHVLGLPFGPRTFRSFKRDNTGTTVLRRSSRGDGFAVQRLNDTAHLGP